MKRIALILMLFTGLAVLATPAMASDFSYGHSSLHHNFGRRALAHEAYHHRQQHQDLHRPTSHISFGHSSIGHSSFGHSSIGHSSIGHSSFSPSHSRGIGIHTRRLSIHLDF